MCINAPRPLQYRSARFQAGIVNRIGSTTPRRYRLGHDVVYLTTGPRQNLAVWFRGRLLMILTVRQEGHGDDATLVLVTHQATDAALAQTVDELHGLDVVRADASVMRVEGEDG